MSNNTNAPSREILCPSCGKIFTYTGSSPTRRFCDECKRTYKDRKFNYSYERVYRTSTCRKCGKTFEVTGRLRNYCQDCIDKYGQKALWREYETTRKRLYRENEKNNHKVKHLICLQCGKGFESISLHRKYCDTCRAIYKSHISEMTAEKRKPRKITINDIVSRAEEAGMSYGEYVSRYHV